MNTEEQLNLISLAWGKQDGYCFFPWIDGTATDREQRIKSYHEGPAFHWPEDRPKIVKHMEQHQDDDLYWCPSLFEAPRRQLEVAMDEHALWADLDEVNPSEIDEEYRPTIAWESSPGRYQALWLIQRGFDIQGAAWPGGENQKLTYYLGADVGGWDITQLLRIPGWKNHKPEHRGGTRQGPNKKLKSPPRGRLLWNDRTRRYLPDHFQDLPEVSAGLGVVKDILDEEIDRVDRHAVWGRVRLKVSGRVREFISSKSVTGDRSEVLWEIERELADAGCSVVEIVAIVRDTVWNKFDGRSDELRRLTTEAAKAVAAKSEAVESGSDLEPVADEDRPTVMRLGQLLQTVKPPVWLVEGIWTRGSCGFIAGQPKTFKSWCALDLAMSVATGQPFLGHFPVRIPGPVLYVQEEDGLPLLKLRSDKIWPGKQADKMIVMGDGDIEWVPGEDLGALDEAPLDAVVRGGVTISDAGWQSWLDETLSAGEYVLLVMDPLMMLAGEVEENRAGDMTTKIFRPLKQLADKHGVAIALVHHLKKGDWTGGRGGQMMLGSVANHAWAEDSLYFQLSKGKIAVERESKHTTSGGFEIANVKNKVWQPVVMNERGDLDDHEEDQERGEVRQVRSNGASTRRPDPKSLIALRELGPGKHSTKKIAEAAGLTTGGAWKQLVRLEESDRVEKVTPQTWKLVG